MFKKKSKGKKAKAVSMPEKSQSLPAANMEAAGLFDESPDKSRVQNKFRVPDDQLDREILTEVLPVPKSKGKSKPKTENVFMQQQLETSKESVDMLIKTNDFLGNNYQELTMTDRLDEEPIGEMKKSFIPPRNIDALFGNYSDKKSITFDDDDDDDAYLSESEGNSEDEKRKKKSKKRPSQKVAPGLGRKSIRPPDHLTLKRKQLFLDFDSVMHYPVNRCPEIITHFKDRPVTLDFSGVDQLTDVVFRIFLEHWNEKTFKLVQSVSLRGCVNITDIGIQWMAKCFPSLKQVTLDGLLKVTEEGLTYLAENHPDLKTVSITGTSVKVLSEGVIKKWSLSSANGCPLVSPERTKMAQAKDQVVDKFKVCILQNGHQQKSVTSFLSGEKSSLQQPMRIQQNFKLSKDVKLNIFEFNEMLLDIMMSKRTIFVLTYDDKDEESVKSTAARLVGIMCHIVIKVSRAVFIILGLSDGQQKAVNSNLMSEEINKSIKAILQGMDNPADLKDKLKAKLQGMGFPDQQLMGRSMAVYDTLANMDKNPNNYLQFLDVDLAVPEDSKKLSAVFEKSVKMISDLWTAYRSLSKDFLDGVEKIPDKIGDHLVLLNVKLSEKSKWNDKDSALFSPTCSVLHMLGSVVHMQVKSREEFVTTPSHFCEVINSILSIPEENSPNNGRISCLGDNVLVRTADELEKNLRKTIKGTLQSSQYISTMCDLGIGHMSSMFLAYCEMEDKPCVPVGHRLNVSSNRQILCAMQTRYICDKPSSMVQHHDHYKLLPRRLKNDHFWKAGMPDTLQVLYTYEFAYQVPDIVMVKLIHLASKLRRPTLAWKKGLVLEESLVEVVMELKNQKDGSCLTLVAHTLKQDKFAEMVWNTVEQYKLIVDYVLMTHALVAKVKCESGVDKPAHVRGFLSGHRFLSSNTDHTRCEICGLSLQNCLLLSDLVMKLNPAFTNYDGLEATFGDSDCISFDGSIVTATVVPGKVLLPIYLSPYSHNQYSVTLLHNDVQSISVGLRDMAGFVEVWLDGRIEYTKNVNDFDSIHRYKMSRAPVKGETITLHLMPDEKNLKHCLLMVWCHNELLAEHPLNSTAWQVEITHSFQNDGNSYILTDLYGSDREQTIGHTMEPSMKLEAHDRLNPSLMCVATVEKINEDGQLWIHFDGWTNRYDYWADPTSPDLHPMGYMNHRGDKLEGYNPTLQPPKSYEEQFSWGKYLNETGTLPVPYSFFTDEQKSDTPYDSEISFLDEYPGLMGKMVKSGYHCASHKLRSSVYEKQVWDNLNATHNAMQLDNPLTNFTQFFCLLPSPLDATLMRYPSRVRIQDLSKLQLHTLCPGQRMEILHFVDEAGKEIDKKMKASVGKMFDLISLCAKSLILQQTTLPKLASKLCPGIEKLLPSEAELRMKRMLLQVLYFTQINPLIHKIKTTVSDKEVKEHTTKIFADFSMFNKGQMTRCTSHKMALSFNQEFADFPMEAFTSVGLFITKLHFVACSLSSLPEAFFKELNKLRDLNFSKNKLTDLPSDIEQLTDLESLDVSSNKLTSLSENLKKVQDSLQILIISDNPFEKFPTVVWSCTQLQKLEADNVGIVTGANNIKDLKKLRILSLSGNVLKPFPKEIEDLPLEQLDLSGIPWITDKSIQHFNIDRFNTAIHKVAAMRSMDQKARKALFDSCDKKLSGTLDEMEIEILNTKILEMFPRFGDKMKEGGIPDEVFKMKTLKSLKLRFHDLKSVSDKIESLESLSKIDLSYNPNLESLASQMGALPLKEILVAGCSSMKTPPKEIISRGFSSIYGYLKRLQLGSVPCTRTKLMMVGLGGAGKTSLVRALTSANYTTYYDYDESITDGIDITEWKVKVKEQNEPLVYSVWDFAGQTVYYNTHQFFLSNRAVYLLLWNIRLGYEHAGLDFWLSSIACHAPKAPIIIVGTHCDKVEKSHIPTDEMMKRFPQIRSFHFVSSYSGEGIADLRTDLTECTLKEKYMGERIPEAWLSLEEKIKRKHAVDDLDLMPFYEIESLAATCGIFDNTEMIEALQFLHDLGSIQFFNTDFLRSQIVIYPQWIVDVMACVVSVHAGPIKEGKFFYSVMGEVWKDYPKELHPWLLRLTEEFDLTFPLHDEDANLVPCLLPNTEAKYTWPEVDHQLGHRETKMIYHFQYLPAGLFNRVQVRLHQFCDRSTIWSKGSLLKKNNHRAIILQTSPSEVLVKAQGFKPENMLYLVHEVFEGLITEAYDGVRYDYSIPCMECLNIQYPDPSLFCASKIKRAVEMKAPFLQCDHNFHTLSIPELQASMPPDRNSEFDAHLGRSMRDLVELSNDMTADIFFIYSQKNVPSLREEKKLVHPGRIIEDLNKVGFKVYVADNPETADVKQLTLLLKNAQIVLFGMSDEFMQTEQCKNLLYFTKETLRKTILLVLLGNSQTWRSSDILLTDQVFVSMQECGRYDTRIKELEDTINLKTKKNKVQGEVTCFISYCWKNSRQAIEKGSRASAGSVGWGDPRGIKEMIEKNSIPCWMDINQVGQNGLFEDIAQGLRKAKLMVACLSNEYATSTMCQMEFRFALTTLKIPVIVVVVGTGYDWEKTEVGMLALGYNCPKVNLQNENPAGLMDVLKLVKDRIPESVGETPETRNEKENQLAFQEVLELAQRKFLRQLAQYSDTMMIADYPRLFIIDIDKDVPAAKDGKEPADRKKNTAAKTEECTETTKPCNEKQECCDGEDQAADKNHDAPKKSGYCFKVLCEYDQGWHDVPGSIPFRIHYANQQEDIFSKVAPYVARIMSILKHSTLQLPCLTTPEGEMFRNKLDAMCANNNPEFKAEYLYLRTMLIMENDLETIIGPLKLCHLPNGKQAWLCEEHQHFSKTAALFKEQLEQRIPIPSVEKTTEKAPDTTKQARGEGLPTVPEDKETSSEETNVLGKASTTGNFRPTMPSRQLNRTTSSACSVM